MTRSNMLWGYENARYTDIYQAYKSPSYNKVKAYRNCLETMRKMGGYDGRICSANCHFFTFAFRWKKDGKECLRYDTGRNTYDISLE